MYVAIREEVAHDKITAFEKCIAVSIFYSAHGLLLCPDIAHSGEMEEKIKHFSLCQPLMLLVFPLEGLPCTVCDRKSLKW